MAFGEVLFIRCEIRKGANPWRFLKPMLSSGCGEGKQQLSFTPVSSANLAHFRSQNSLLFPIQYPDKFYTSILQYESVHAYLGKPSLDKYFH